MLMLRAGFAAPGLHHAMPKIRQNTPRLPICKMALVPARVRFPQRLDCASSAAQCSRNARFVLLRLAACPVRPSKMDTRKAARPVDACRHGRRGMRAQRDAEMLHQLLHRLSKE